MKKPRLILSDAALADIVEQADWYTVQSGASLTRKWEGAVTDAILELVRRPSAGACCQFRSSELSGVRRTAIPGFPKHLLFYRFEAGELLILRVVHGARDLERLL